MRTIVFRLKANSSFTVRCICELRLDEIIAENPNYTSTQASLDGTFIFRDKTPQGDHQYFINMIQDIFGALYGGMMVIEDDFLFSRNITKDGINANWVIDSYLKNIEAKLGS